MESLVGRDKESMVIMMIIQKKKEISADGETFHTKPGC